MNVQLDDYNNDRLYQKEKNILAIAVKINYNVNIISDNNTQFRGTKHIVHML
jgi:hypothetical protein